MITKTAPRLATGVLTLVGALAVSLPASRALADDNDLVLARLAAKNSTNNGVVPDVQAFRSLVSELGVVFAPRNLAPADTLGFSGFQFSSEFSYTSINSGRAFWCATEESESCAPGFKRSGTIPTFGIFARKGFWFPLPSFEIGGGAVHIFGSRLWSGQAYGKIAMHEGYHGWPIPSVAVRAAVARLFGVEQLDLTNVSLDISASKRFAIQGTFSVAPYLGFAFLWIVPRSQPIDKTPETSPINSDDILFNFIFPDQKRIVRKRVFTGAKLKYYVFALTLEIDHAFAGSSKDDLEGPPMSCDTATGDQKGNCDAQDQSGSQRTYSVAFSLDF